MNDRELKIWSYELAKKNVIRNKARTLAERKTLIQRLNNLINDEEFLLEREKQADKLK